MTRLNDCLILGAGAGDAMAVVVVMASVPFEWAGVLLALLYCIERNNRVKEEKLVFWRLTQHVCDNKLWERIRSMKKNIAEQLRDAVQAALDAGWSVYALANAAEIPHSGLQMWVSGVRQGIKLDTAAKLAAFFGQDLTKPKIPKPADDVMPQKGPAKKKPAKKRKT